MDAQLGLRIRTARLLAQLSQGDLAAATGTDQAYISRIERGERTPTLEGLYTLAKALDLPVVDLLGAQSGYTGDTEQTADAAQGLQALLSDQSLMSALAITHSEITWLESLTLPIQTDKDGWVAMLMTYRAITR